MIGKLVLLKIGVMMNKYVTTVTQKGQVTIPGELRKALKIKPKDRVAFELVDGDVRLRPISSWVASTYGSVKPLTRPEDFSRIRQEAEEEWANARER